MEFKSSLYLHLLFIGLLVILYHLRQHLFYTPLDDIVGNGVDGCIGVGIDGHDDGTLLHTYGVLYLSADTASDVELWTYGEPRLSYHTIVIYVTGIYGCAAGTHLSV